MATVRPMLAAHAPEDLEALRYPLLASPKLDGIRCLIINGVAVSRTLKPIRNAYIQRQLGRHELNGFDGELIAGDPTAKDCYLKTNSAVMSAAGEPDVSFFVFDTISDPGLPFSRRLGMANGILSGGMLVPHRHTRISSAASLEEYEEEMLAEGHEGLILRDPNAPYKFGRSTEKQQAMLKLKRFVDGEAVVVGWEERLHNANEATLDERGYTKRSSHQENKIGTGTLGALLCEAGDVQFSIGTGFDDATRALLWAQRDTLAGRIVKYKHFPIGVKDRPRHSVFIGFRHPDDISNGV